MARPRYHFLTIAPLAWLAHRRWGKVAGAGALAAGVLIDGDHLVDYALARLRNRRSHYVAPLHGWELAVLATLVALLPAPRRSRPGYALTRALWQHHGAWLTALAAGLAIGWWVHLVQDTLTNRPRHPVVYSLLYRVAGGFKRELTGWGEHTNFHGWSKQPWYRWF